jgi:single-strand DNA-binding protein
MARSFNQVILVGNLARDPELRTIPSGQSVASFAVATNRVWNDQSGEQQEQTDFHNIVAWGRLAELAEQYLTKGRKVLIVGRLQTRSWEGEDGKKNYRTEIVASEINFLDRAGDDSAGASANTGSAPADKPKAEPKKSQDKDVEIEDLEGDIDLSDIPF